MDNHILYIAHSQGLTNGWMTDMDGKQQIQTSTDRGNATKNSMYLLGQ